MQRNLKQKLAAAAAAAVLLAGAAVAAVSATGQSNGHIARHSRPLAGDVSRAAAYLGIPATQLESDLRSGKSLAQVAGASAGKSAAGLLDALVTAKRSNLAKATANLTRHVTAEINRAGGPGSGLLGGGARLRGLLATSARYLGVPPRQLRAELHGGRTLAQIADATAGRSQAGLIAALAQPRQARIAARVAAGKLTKAKQATRLAHLQQWLARVTERSFRKSAAP